MRFKTCRLCDSDDTDIIGSTRGHRTNELIPIIKCNNCSHFSLYPTIYSQYKNPHWDGVEYYLSQEAKSRRYYTCVLNDIKNHIDEPGINAKPTLLDIGSGLGWSLIAANTLGFDATGVEPETILTHFARERLNLNVKNCNIEEYIDQEWSGQKYDVIIINQVLEHVSKPKEFLKESLKLLKKEGILFISVPPTNRVNLFIGRISLALGFLEHIKSHHLNPFHDPEEHISTFTRKSLRSLFASCNLYQPVSARFKSNELLPSSRLYSWIRKRANALRLKNEFYLKFVTKQETY